MNLTKNWQETKNGNLYLEGGDFYISYNSMNGTLVSEIPMFASDEGSSETALCADGSFMILNGDFRAEYEVLVDCGFEACYAFYLNNKAKHGSSWSTE
jgi:hypothetical protein